MMLITVPIAKVHLSLVEDLLDPVFVLQRSRHVRYEYSRVFGYMESLDECVLSLEVLYLNKRYRRSQLIELWCS